MKEHRLNQFDILKGIGILLVMVGHTPIPWKIWIYGFHMPLFFFCSGFFFKRREFKEDIKRAAKTLLVPWVTFSLVLFVFKVGFGIFQTHSLGTIISQFKEINLLDENCYVLYRTIWFLPCLFIVKLIGLIVYKCNLLVVSAFSLGSFFMAQFFQKIDINIPFFIDTAMGMFVFYHLGYYFKLSNLYKKFIFNLMFGLIIIYTLLVLWLNPHVEIKDNVYPFYLVIISGVAIWGLYELSVKFGDLRNWTVQIFEHLGASSLILLGLHSPLYDFILTPFLLRMGLPYELWFIPMIILITPIILSIEKNVLQKAPFLLGK